MSALVDGRECESTDGGGTHMTLVEASNDAGAFLRLLRHRGGGCRRIRWRSLLCRQIFECAVIELSKCEENRARRLVSW